MGRREQRGRRQERGGRLAGSAGAISNLFSFEGTNGAYPQAGLAQGSDLNLYGTTTNGSANGYGNIFEISGFPAAITLQPASRDFTNGGTVDFAVQASGSGPLAYQWTFDGTNIKGATSSNLVLANEVLANNAGSYAVIVSNSVSVVTSSVATLTIPAPTNAITFPKTGLTVTTNRQTFRGTAEINKAPKTDMVAQVRCQITPGTNWTLATTKNHWTNWSITNVLQPGTNIFKAYSVDPMGNPSPTNSVSVFYSTPSTLNLLTNGYGTINPGFANKGSGLAMGLRYSNLHVGINYSVTAAPKPGNLFSSWTGINSTGTIATNSNPLTFLMESNMTLTASFVTNSFRAAVGTYNGLFYVTNGVGAESSGLLQNLTVGTNVAYTGKLLVGGASYSVSGSFDPSGNATNQIPLASGLGNLTLGMQLNWNSTPPQIIGTVQGTNGGAWMASLLAELAASNQLSAQYTLLLLSGTNFPTGDGYVLLTNHAGAATVTGALADGAAFSESVAISETGALPVYATPYNTNGGLLLGRLVMSNGVPEGDLTWIRPAATNGLFTNSFTNVLQVQSELWINPPTNTPAVILTNGQLVISNAGAGVLLTFTNVAVSNNVLVELGGAGNPANSLTGSINPANGSLTVTFGNGNGTNTTTGAGVMLQNNNTGGGYFVTTTNAGAISLLNSSNNFPPRILQQPASQTFAAKATNHFTVGATGSEPLSYQWQLNGANLTDGGTFSGSTSNTLIIGPETATHDAGSYSVIVSNFTGTTVTSSVVTLTIPAPAITITAPSPNTTVSNAALTVKGTATGPVGVTHVQYQLKGSDWSSAATTNNWSVTVILAPGSNVFQAYSVDFLGNPSPTNSLTVEYVQCSLLTLRTSGSGTVIRHFIGNNLALGTNYFVMAVPKPNNVFSNWTSGTSSNELTNYPVART